MKKRAALTDMLQIYRARFVEDRCTQTASSLTFTTLLAIVPIVTLALTVVAAFPGFESLLNNVSSFVRNNLLPESVDLITSFTAKFSENAARLSAVGIIFLGVTALLLMFTIERAFNGIWRVSRPRPLLQRILVYWTALTIGPLLIGASLSVTSYLITLSLGMIDHPPGVGVLMLKVMSLLFTSCALALLYFTVPNRRIRSWDAVLGGVAAGICFDAMKQGFGFYVTHFPGDKLVYGAFAAVPIFLIWIYLSWLIVIGGAVFVALLPEWRVRAAQTRTVAGSELFVALHVLKLLRRAHRAGDVVTLSQLHHAVKMRHDHLEAVLDAVAGAGWVVRHGLDGWTLNRDAATIMLEDVFRLFVFHDDVGAAARHADPQLDFMLRDISGRLSGDLRISLAELFDLAEREEAHGAAAARVIAS